MSYITILEYDDIQTLNLQARNVIPPVPYIYKNCMGKMEINTVPQLGSASFLARNA
jgi:hypothetical protein